MLSSVLLLVQGRTQAGRPPHAHLGCSFPSHRHAQGCGSRAILDPVKVTVKINPYRAVIGTVEMSKDLPERTYRGRREGTELRTLRREPR